MMNNMAAGDFPMWLESTIVVAVGTGAIVCMGWLINRAMIRSVAWQKTVWQTSILAILVLLVCELSGFSGVLVRMGRVCLTNRSYDRPRSLSSRQAVADAGSLRVSTAAPVALPGRKPHLDLPADSDQAAGIADADQQWNRSSYSELAWIDPPVSWAPSWSQAETHRQELLVGKPNVRRPQAWVAETAAEMASSEVDGVDMAVSPITAAKTEVTEQEMRGTSRASRGTETIRSDLLPNSTAAGSGISGDERAPESQGIWPLVTWLLVTMVFVTRLGLQRIRLGVFGRRCEPASDITTRRDVAHLAQRLGVRGSIRLWETQALRVPVSWGVWRPTIVLPHGFSDRLKRDEQRVVLAHELAHLAAHDSAWQLMSSLLCALLWWHPAVFILRRKLQTTSELAADDAARLIPGGPTLLASCLVALGRELSGPQPLGWLSADGNPFQSGLGRRVQRLLDLPADRWRPSCRRGRTMTKTLVPVLLVLTTVFSTAWVRAQAPIPKGGEPMSLLSQAWRQSLMVTTAMALVVPLTGNERATWTTDVAMAESTVDDEQPIRVSPEDPQNREEDDERAERREREEMEQAERDEREEVERRERQRMERLETSEKNDRQRDERRVLDRERNELREKIEVTKDRLSHQLPDHEAQKMRQALKEMTDRIWQINRELGEAQEHPDHPEAEARHRELVDELMRLENHRFELQIEQQMLSDDQQDRLHDLRRELHEVADRIRDIYKRHQDLPLELAERITRRQMEKLERTARRLKEQDRHDLAERIGGLMHEVEEGLRQKMDWMRGHGGPVAPIRPQTTPGERERRLHHLRVAIDNLHAAGMHKIAEELKRETEELLGKPRIERPERRLLPEVQPEGRGQPEWRPLPAGEREHPKLEREPNHEARELRGQMDEIRQEVQELRRMIQQLHERR